MTTNFNLTKNTLNKITGLTDGKTYFFQAFFKAWSGEFEKTDIEFLSSVSSSTPSVSLKGLKNNCFKKTKYENVDLYAKTTKDNVLLVIEEC